MKKRCSILQAPAMAASVFLFVPLLAQGGPYTFQTINDSADLAFNQLLGIDNAGSIAGYYGDGFTVANHGFTVTPPYGQGSFVNENYPGAAQTQVIGINNQGTSVGFYADAAGNNFGFVYQGGTFTPLANTNTPNQLLGVNDNNLAVGFFANTAGSTQAFAYDIVAKHSFFINRFGTVQVLQSVATGVNDLEDFSGFLQLTNGNTEGFYLDHAQKSAVEFEVPGSTNTMFLGLNNNGLVVGTYVDANGLSHGLLYNTVTGAYQTVDDPLASPNPAFDITGTTINGINDAGKLVGFYSDGTNVNGFLATPNSPEPASAGLMGMSSLLGLLIYWKAKTRGA
jgi:hypothetical protein